MKGRVLKSWTVAEHEQLVHISNRVREMVANGNTRSDIYDYIAERMNDGVSSRVLIFAGIRAGEMLKDKNKIAQEEIQAELQEG